MRTQNKYKWDWTLNIERIQKLELELIHKPQ